MIVRPAPLVSLVPAALLALALTGCSFSVGATEVTQADLEGQVAENIEGENADRAEIACEGPLAAEVDATQDCLVTLDGGATGVRFVVTEVDGSDVSYESTIYLEADEVATKIAETIESQGFPVESVECAGELAAEVDETTECTVVEEGGPESTVLATVDGVDGLSVDFSFDRV